jgi:hypothetical protein
MRDPRGSRSAYLDCTLRRRCECFQRPPPRCFQRQETGTSICSIQQRLHLLKQRERLTGVIGLRLKTPARASKRVILERCSPKSLAASATVLESIANDANDLSLLVRSQFSSAAHLDATIASRGQASPRFATYRQRLRVAATGTLCAGLILRRMTLLQSSPARFLSTSAVN